MVDNNNPTNQFHPYQPMDAVPHKDKPVSTGLSSVLEKLGVNPDSLSNIDVKASLNNMRGKVNSKNSGMILGGLAALVIGASLIRKRSSSRKP